MPPKLPLRFFRWFCQPDLKDTIEGDLTELYKERLKESGKTKANIKFTIDVLFLFRPGIIKSMEGHRKLNNYDMYKNYLKTAFRNLINSKFYSSLNLIGLTLGLTVGLLILLWINDELSYNMFNSKVDQIYRVNVNLESAGHKFAVQVVQPTIAYYGLNEVPEIEQAVRVSECNDYTVFRYKDTSLKGNVAVYTDPSLYKMFDYPLLNGDVDNPFPVTESVILTQSAAKRFFGDVDPMGKILTADNKDNFIVSGIMADFPDNSFLVCDILFSTSLVKKRNAEKGWRSFDEDDWGNYGWVTFFQLKPGTSLKSVEDKLTQINVSHQPGLKPVDVGAYTIQPLKDIHLYSPDGSSAGMQTVKIFMVVALLILLIASINYVNLSTARALLRYKEVSVRKIIGAARKQLFTQFTIQTLLFFFIALALAFVLISLAMPLYNILAGKHMQFNILDPSLWKVIGITLCLTFIASSIYPAWLLSSFHPVNMLKGKLSARTGNTSFRKVLVVCQFAFSVGLIIATITISRQLNFIQHKELGYDKAFMLSMNMNNMQGHFQKVKEDLQAIPGISGVTSGTNDIVGVYGSSLDVDWDGKDPNGSFFIHSMGIDQDFISLFQIRLKEGKGFTGAKTDSSYFILNETAVKEAGIKNPIGKRLRLFRTEGTIIGVVKDFNFASLHRKIEPFVFYYQASSPKIFVKADGKTAQATIQSIEKIWKQYNEGFPFDYTFLDETYGKQYQSEQRISTLFTIFTAVAIIISCLGLLGLATYTGQIRVKEIGIRKVLGAGVGNITLLLSKDFLMLIGIAIVIASPVTWFIMQKWLQGFAYQSGLQWWIIALAGVSAISVAIFTIGFQSIRTARENPVKSLRSE